MEKEKTKSFEDLLKRLQKISEMLDSNTLGLDESVTLYEEGVLLTKLCYEKLSTASIKVTELKGDLERSIKIDVQQD
ncbi:MAG: exodeoxyribonuclease VII small subunit [bacterium]